MRVCVCVFDISNNTPGLHETNSLVRQARVVHGPRLLLAQCAQVPMRRCRRRTCPNRVHDDVNHICAQTEMNGQTSIYSCIDGIHIRRCIALAVTPTWRCQHASKRRGQGQMRVWTFSYEHCAPATASTVAVSHGNAPSSGYKV